MSFDLVLVNVRWELWFDLFSKRAPQFALCDSVSGLCRKGFVGLIVEASKEPVFEAVPHVFARSHGISEGQESEKIDMVRNS